MSAMRSVMNASRKYSGRELLAEYDSVWDVTELSAPTKYARDALHYAVCRCYADARCSNIRWDGAAWIIDGDHVAEIMAADCAFPREYCPRRTLVEILCAAIDSARKEDL